MSRTDDNTPIDSELKAYLAGEDGVSAAYRQAGAEEPPAELDQLILAAARNAVQKDKPRATTHSRQRFSLAASFMVGVLVTSMYFNQEGDFAETSATSTAREERIISQSVEQPSPAFAPATPEDTAGETQPAAPAVATDETLTQQDAAQAVRLSEEVPRSVASIAPAQLERREAAQSKAEADTAAIENSSAAQTQSNTADANRVASENATPAAEAGIGATAGPRPPGSEAVGTDVPGAQLEEIQVTGSRIRSDTEVDSSYRQTREEWVIKIIALREEALGEAELLEELNGQLVEEVELFLETYPDFDLDAELQALEE